MYYKYTHNSFHRLKENICSFKFCIPRRSKYNYTEHFKTQHLIQSQLLAEDQIIPAIDNEMD